jgi:hypothetical protein
MDIFPVHGKMDKALSLLSTAYEINSLWHAAFSAAFLDLQPKTKPMSLPPPENYTPYIETILLL